MAKQNYGQGIIRALVNQYKSNNGNGNDNSFGNWGKNKFYLERTERTPRKDLVEPKDDPNWELVFSDEFDGTSLDHSKWNTTYYYGARTNSFNNEAQYYVDDAFEFNDGILRIVGEKQDTPVEAFEPIDAYLLTEQGKDLSFDYTSGLLSGHDKFAFTNGYMEIRAKVPSGQGLWPAFWMLPNSGEWPPEIDMMEILGDQTDTAYQTLHYQDPSQENGRNMQGGYYSGIDFSEDFHTFAAEWNSDSITWHIDDVEVFTVENNIPNQPMYLLANLAIGGDWPGMPDETTPGLSTFDIDYIRVYQNQEGTLHGGLADDTLSRNNGNISGEDGNDTLTLSGVGSLYGGNGNDTLIGGNGDNTLRGGRGNDTLNGRRGNDTLRGGRGDDILNGGRGSDTLRGGRGDDILNGGRGSDTLRSGRGNDTLNGGHGSDTLRGGRGDDILNGGRGGDIFVVARSQGTDTIEDFSDRTDLIGLSGGLGFNDLGFSGEAINFGAETLAILTGIDSTTLTVNDFITV